MASEWTSASRAGRKAGSSSRCCAHGLHSNTRAWVFGPEAPSQPAIGYSFNLFSLANDGGLAHEAIIYAEAGRMAGVYAVGSSDTLDGFLTFAADEPPFRSHPDADAQRRRTAEVFAGGGWGVPRLVEAMHALPDDLHSDTAT